MYTPGTECEKIGGHMYYYLKISGKYNVYVFLEHALHKINTDMPSLLDAKSFARKFAKVYKENSNA